MARRVLIIGLDGASPELVARWRDDLPNLSRLMAEGAWGTLKSTMPPFTVPAWYTFATGKNPGRLGIYGFKRRRPGTYTYSIVNFSNCPAQPIWDILAAGGYRSIIFNLPGTFPPPHAHGVTVSGMPAPINDGHLIFTHPEELSRELDRLFGPYQIEADVSFDEEDPSGYFDNWLQVTETHTQAALHLASRYPWNLVIDVHVFVDRISHKYWQYMDIEHPLHDPVQVKRCGDAIKRAYIVEDKRIGTLLSLVNGQDLVLVVSDHGFTTCYQEFCVNRWLMNNGYLHLIDRGMSTKHAELALGWLHSFLLRAYHQQPWIQRVWRPFGRRLFSKAKQAAPGLNFLAAVDWSRSVAFADSGQGLRLNLKGREPLGIVEPGTQAERLLAELSARLSSIRDPLSGGPLVDAVYHKQEIYRGPYLDAAPDIVLSSENSGDSFHRIASGEADKRIRATSHPLLRLTIRWKSPAHFHPSRCPYRAWTIPV